MRLDKGRRLTNRESVNELILPFEEMNKFSADVPFEPDCPYISPQHGATVWPFGVHEKLSCSPCGPARRRVVPA